jgi:chaperonin GroEL (HSP60 family)
MPERTKQFKIYLLLFLSRQILFAIVGHASVLNMFVLAVQVVAGGGAVEAALSVYLENLATTLGSREQLAIAEFAESLLIIPKVLT